MTDDRSIDPNRPRRVVLRARARSPHRRRLLVLGAVVPGLLALSPSLGDAKASLRSQDSDRRALLEIAHARHHAQLPGAVTLGALIEAQRSERRARPVAPARPEPLARGASRWVAQAGAFSSADAADRHRTRLVAVAGDAVLHVRDAGGLHRVASAAATRDAATQICTRLQARGAACIVRRAEPTD